MRTEPSIPGESDGSTEFPGPHIPARMRVAFVSANRENLPDAVIPLGLLYVHGATPDRHEKAFWDLCFEDDPYAAIQARISDFQPEVIAIGLRNIQNNDYTGIQDNLGYYCGLIDAVRAVTSAKVVVGGAGFSVMPTELMKHLRPDFGISGEGEKPFPALLSALETGTTDYATIPNLYWMNGDHVELGQRAQAYVDMDTIEIPNRTILDRRYYTDFGIDSLQTKRGCSLRCDYCTYPTIEGRVTRRRSPKLVADEFEAVREQNPSVEHIFVVDSVFNLPPKHAKAICRELIVRKWDVPWTCYANPLKFDEELGELMAAARCVGMEIGSDSGSDEILIKLRKGFDTQQIESIRDISARAGLKDCHSFILGTPGETLDHVRTTLDFIVNLDPFAAILVCWVDDYEALDPALRRERRKLRDDVYALLDASKSMYPRWIIPPLGVNFDPRLFAVLRRLGKTGPLWQHIDMLPAGMRRARPPKSPRRTGLPLV